MLLSFIVLGCILALVFGTWAGVSHVLSYNFTRQGESITKNVTVTASGELNIDETVPGSGNITFNCAIDVSVLKSIYIQCDGDVVLTTNDDGTPDDTLNISDDEPLSWHEGCGLPNPFASDVDVVTIKATKATAGNASLSIRLLQDASP